MISLGGRQETRVIEQDMMQQLITGGAPLP